MSDSNLPSNVTKFKSWRASPLKMAKICSLVVLLSVVIIYCTSPLRLVSVYYVEKQMAKGDLSDARNLLFGLTSVRALFIVYAPYVSTDSYLKCYKNASDEDTRGFILWTLLWQERKEGYYLFDQVPSESRYFILSKLCHAAIVHRAKLGKDLDVFVDNLFTLCRHAKAKHKEEPLRSLKEIVEEVVEQELGASKKS